MRRLRGSPSLLPSMPSPSDFVALQCNDTDGRSPSSPHGGTIVTSEIQSMERWRLPQPEGDLQARIFRFPRSALHNRRNMGQSLSRCASRSARKATHADCVVSKVVHRCQSSVKGATPRITDITSTRTPAASGCRQRKCTAWPSRDTLLPAAVRRSAPPATDRGQRPTGASFQLPPRRRCPYRG